MKICYNGCMQSESLLKSFFRNKWVIAILVADVVAVVAIVAIVIVNTLKTSILEFNIAPIGATISVNGDDSYSNGSYHFSPGKYDVTIYYDGLGSKSFSIDLERDSVKVVSAFLSGGSDFSFYELKENYGSFAKLAEIASASNNITIDQDSSAEAFIQKFEKNYEFLDILPIVERTPSQYGSEYGVRYEYDIFTIEDGRDTNECKMTLCLYVTDTLADRKAFAFSVIEKFGYDPNDFEIIYKTIERE